MAAARRSTGKKAPPEPLSEDDVKRLNDILRTARTMWLGFLGAVVFSFVTLFSIRSADYFTLSRTLELPLVGVSVPVKTFVFSGALFVLAYFVYLHIYLETLWRELGGTSPNREKPRPDQLTPWIVSDWVLRLRDEPRTNDNAKNTRHSLHWLGTGASVAIVWLLGPCVLFGFWIASMPSHDLWTILPIALMMTVAIWFGWHSYRYARSLIVERKTTPVSVRGIVYLVCAALLISGWSWVKAGAEIPVVSYEKRAVCPEEGYPAEYNHTFATLISVFFLPRTAYLDGTELTERPSDWVDRQFAREDFLKDWLDRREKTKGAQAQGCKSGARLPVARFRTGN